MSVIYLVDTQVTPITNSRIVDVILNPSATGEVRVDGLTPIRIPDGVRVVDPTSFSDLLTQKYAGILAQYPGFTNIIFDDLLDATGVQIAAPPSDMRKSGERATVGGAFNATAVDVSAFGTLTQCVLVYEQFFWRYVDDKNGRIARYYVESPPVAAHQVSVSANGGTDENLALSGDLVAFDLDEQGDSVQVEFKTAIGQAGTNAEGRLLQVGSWAVIY